ncbi:copper transport protein ATX1-like [Typha angustifolia]|uniref:copper transport protein ATX1-like n=1 Tax=Typha angustifolia TaxID=59011 RepID=UPI003C2C3835
MAETVVLRVTMSCQGCAGAVKRALTKMEGVESFDVDLKEQKVTVKGNVKPDAVLETVSKTGKKTIFWEVEPENKDAASSATLDSPLANKDVAPAATEDSSPAVKETAAPLPTDDAAPVATENAAPAATENAAPAANSDVLPPTASATA